MSLTTQLTKDDKKVLYIVALVWGVELLYYFKAVVLRLPLINEFADIFVPIVVIISILCMMSSIVKKFKATDFFFYLGCLTLYIITYLTFPINERWLDMFMPIVFFQVLPYFFLGLLLDPQKQLRVIEYVSMAYIVLSLIYLYLTFSTRDVDGEEMGAAYALLPHLLIVFNSCLRNFKWYSLLIFLLGLLRLLGTGNRGSLVCIAFFAIVYFLFCSENKHKWVVVLLLGAVTFLGWSRQDFIFDFFSNILGEFGFSTRVFDLAMASELADANGRDTIATFFTGKIREGGFLGYGIFGDRSLLNDPEGYPHNLVLEILIDFGVPLGALILIVVAILFFAAFKSCKSTVSKSLFFVLFTVGFVTFFFSDSYLENPMFFLLVGYCVRLVRDSRIFENNLFKLTTSNENSIR